MASTYLTRTLGTATNLKKYTISCWVKRSGISALQEIISSNSASNYGRIHFEANDRLRFSFGSTSNGLIETNRLFRDTSAWYHIVCVADTTLATDDDRLKIYVNGTEETSFASRTNPTLNEDSTRLNSANIHSVGSLIVSGSHSQYLNGSLAHFHFIDGTAYDASAFGETDSTTGIWKPKTAPSVTYGTNGFFLKFENSGAFGTDSSGNGNTFTVNGTMTQTIDTPSNVFATINPLSALATPPTFSNGNLTTAIPTSGGAFRTTLGVSSGKYYCEAKLTTLNNAIIGVQPIDTTYNTNIFNDSNGVGLYSTNGTIYKNTSNLGNIASVSNNDIIGMAIDLDNHNIYFSKNGQYASGLSGSWNQTFDNAYAVSLNTGYTYCIAGSNGSSSTTSNISFNFGNGFFGTTAVSSAQNPDDGIGIFEYDVPTGYRALCTKSINAEEYS